MAEKTLVTSLDVIERLRKIVESKPEDYVYTTEYPACFNFVTSEEPDTMGSWGKEGDPACLVGRLFHTYGITYEDCGNTDSQTSIARLRDSRPDIGFTYNAGILLKVAQSIQDRGGKWRLAMDVVRYTMYILRTEDDKVAY